MCPVLFQRQNVPKLDDFYSNSRWHQVIVAEVEAEAS